MRGLTASDRYRQPDGRWVERKTVRYGGTTVEETQRRYCADAAIYTSSGWAVHHVDWDTKASRPAIAVTYARYVGPADASDVVLEVGESVLGSPRIRATAVASILLTAMWLLLSALGWLLDSGLGIDAGAPLLVAALAGWVIVVAVVLRRHGLIDVLSWAVVGLGSFVLTVSLWFLAVLYVLVEVLGYR